MCDSTIFCQVNCKPGGPVSNRLEISEMFRLTWVSVDLGFDLPGVLPVPRSTVICLVLLWQRGQFHPPPNTKCYT